MPELPALVEASVKGVPLIFVVMGLVQWCRKQGIPPKHLQRVSLAVGLVLGAGYQVTVLVPETAPTTALGAFAFAFGALVYGLALGLLASEVYDTFDGILKKALGR